VTHYSKQRTQAAPPVRAAGSMNGKLEPTSDRAQQSLPACLGPRRRPGLQSELVEDALDHRRLQDGSDDVQLTAVVWQVLKVDLERALEQPGPAHPHRPAVRAVRLARSELPYVWAPGDEGA